MRYFPLPGHPEPLSRVGFGTSRSFAASTPCSSADLLPAMAASLQAGVNFFDTAPVYGQGEAESLLGQFPERKKIFLATKLGPESARAAEVTASVEASLRRLRVDQLDLLQLHWQNPAVPLAETMGAMEALVHKGLVRAIGVCNLSLPGLRAVEACLSRVKVASVQQEYNLFDRTVERDLLPYCQVKKILFLAYSPLHRGRIAGTRECLHVLQEIAQKHKGSAAQVALAWLLRQPSVLPIPNTMSPERARENAASSELELSAEEAARIEQSAQQQARELTPTKILPAPLAAPQAYRTLEEAKRNPQNLVPSPLELADQIRGGEFLKPVRVRPCTEPGFEFELLEGRLRYWAWVLAFGPDRPIAALVDE